MQAVGMLNDHDRLLQVFEFSVFINEWPAMLQLFNPNRMLVHTMLDLREFAQSLNPP
jgi:hypothetical protein